MLNLFAFAGRVNYAKSERLYLQRMNELPEGYPWLYDCFKEKGSHAIRRSERFWDGLWSDLVIGQVLMRSVKSHGGLSRGRGMNENARTIWIHSMHRLAGVHGVMSALTGQIHQTSDQYVEKRETRIERDQRDKTTLQNWFEDHSSFADTKELVSIANGIAASIESGVNCDNAEEIGANIQQSLDDVNYQMSKIKHSEKVKTMSSLLSAVKIDNEDVAIDPMTLFSRLIVMVMGEKTLHHIFLMNIPPMGLLFSKME